MSDNGHLAILHQYSHIFSGHVTAFAIVIRNFRPLCIGGRLCQSTKSNELGLKTEL